MLTCAYLDVSVLELLCLDLFGENRFANHSTLLTLVREFCETTRWLLSMEEGDLGGGRVILKMQSTRLSEVISGLCSSSGHGSEVVIVVTVAVVVVVVQVDVVVDSGSRFSTILHSG